MLVLKYILLFNFFMFLLINGFSQVNGGELIKLEKLFDDGKYENCLYKADNLTYKPDYSRDPEPLLYISMCFYKISVSEDEDLKADYADALKQSIKYAVKFVRKDKNDKLYSENIDYINTLKDELKIIIKKYHDESSYSKVAIYTKLYNKLNRDEDFAVSYYIGVNELLSNNSNGLNTIETAVENLQNQVKDKKVSIDSRMKALIIDAFLKHSEYLVNGGQLAEAKKALELGNSIFPNDGYINMQLKMVDSAINKKKEAKAKSK